jgi:hypothetical protein
MKKYKKFKSGGGEIIGIDGLYAPDGEYVPAEVAERLYEALKATADRLDYLRELWGDEGVTRTVVDQIHAALKFADGETP